MICVLVSKVIVEVHFSFLYQKLKYPLRDTNENWFCDGIITLFSKKIRFLRFWFDDGGLVFVENFIEFYFEEGSVLSGILCDTEE